LSSKPFVSIVVASYNRKYIIAETIDSLISLDYPNDSYEIILIDNFSSDGTVNEVYKNFNESISNGLLKVVPLSYNSGSSGSYVEALNYVYKDWQYMLKMDEDLILEKNCLKELVETAESSENTGVVGGKVYFYKERNKFHAIGSKLSPWFAIAKGLGVNEIDEGQYNKSMNLDALNGCMILISKTIYKEVGWFDTDYFLYYDDHDLMYKSLSKGYKHIYTPKAIGYHDTATGSKKKYSNKLWLYYSVRGSWLFLRKNFSPLSLGFYIYLFMHHVKFFAGLVFLFSNSNKANLRENLSIYLLGYQHGLVNKTGFYDLDKTGIKIVLFSGGRGSGKISNGLRQYARSSGFKLEVVHITNAYDDGKSTGEVRRFYGNSILGPSDVRKIQENQYSFFKTDQSVKDFLNIRFDGNREEILIELQEISKDRTPSTRFIYDLYLSLQPSFRETVREALLHFFEKNFENINLNDFAFSNLIYASLADKYGGLHEAEKIFRRELQIPDPVLLNSEENFYTFALTEAGHLLHDEASIVDYAYVSPIYEVYLSRKPLKKDFLESFGDLKTFEQKKDFVSKYSKLFPNLSSDARDSIDVADIIIYGPGTQYSSLFPTYFTSGLAHSLVNSRALKVLVTNVHHDNETPGFSAVDQIRQAIFYLNQKGQLTFSEEDFIDVMVSNDPIDQDSLYIRPNRTELEQLKIKDIIISDIEDKTDPGKHDPEKVSRIIFNSFNTRWK
tara:strand:+ start:36739 stop:38922 length:2184 start_codon:yes stop_codon:yes gene_type:complete